jgi:hypothetical protein
MFQVGDVAVWYRLANDRRNVDAVPVTIAKIARNGTTVELPDGSRQRVARDYLKWPMPKPAPKTDIRPFTPFLPPRYPPPRIRRCWICGGASEHTRSERCRGACQQ